MTGLLIIETLLLIVIVIGMICLATLYYSLYKGFVALKHVAETALPAQNDVIKGITEEMDSFLDIIRTVEDQALDCYGVADKILRDAQSNKDFAMQTMRSVRSIKNTLVTAGKAQTEGAMNFKFEVPEEDPDEPRS